MKINLYMIQQGPRRAHCDALYDYLRGQGHEVIPHNIHNMSSSEQADADTGMVISYAIGGEQKRVIDEVRGRGIPCVVLEFGYLGDRYEHLGVSLLGPNGVHNNNGDFLLRAEKASDRLDALRGQGAQAAQQTKNGKGKTALILGQVPGDSQLDGKDIVAWTRDATHAMESLGYSVIYRPHPQVIKTDTPLDDAMIGASCVVSYNSTALVRAIQLGIPIFCSDVCQYYGIAGTNLADPKPIAKAKRQQFLANLAHCQYNAKEFRDGTAWAHIQELQSMRTET